MLDAARVTLEKHGDRLNAGYGRYLEVRRLLLIGQLERAESMLADTIAPALLPAREQLYRVPVRFQIRHRLYRRSALLAPEHGATRAPPI
jgi:hypothetical protein